jgi:hypothetical protein
MLVVWLRGEPALRSYEESPQFRQLFEALVGDSVREVSAEGAIPAYALA